MSVRLNITTKKIKQLCGATSYKRGLAFFDAGKVEVISMTNTTATAIVRTTESFYIEIQQFEPLKVTCSCPQLEGYSLQCQHIAAALIAVQQKMPTADEFLEIFQTNNLRVNKGNVFETRQCFELAYVLTPVLYNEQRHWSIKLVHNGQRITSLHKFLHKPNTLHLFNEQTYYFDDVDVAICEQLKQLKVEADCIVLVAASWKVLSPLLQRASNVLYEIDGQMQQVQFIKGVPPIQFHFTEGDNGANLTAQGFHHIKLFPAYNELYDGQKIYELSVENTERIAQLQAMFQQTEQIEFELQQIEHVLKQIIPSLQKIGKVFVSKAVQRMWLEHPLQAHIYLDRIHNRLLAGVEFHYGQVVIQPLEPSQRTVSVLRDEQKEEEILAIFEACQFTETEGGYYMQNDALEYEFLMHVLPKLQKEMHVYATTAVRFRLAKNTVFPRIRVKTHTERTNWVHFSFEMEGIKDEEIKQVLYAIKIKQKFYRLRSGMLLSLETKEMEQIQQFLHMAPQQEDGYLQSLELPILDALKFTAMFEGSDVLQMERSFQQITQQLLQPEMIQIDVPEQLATTLYEYQLQGYKWLKLLSQYGFGGVLADDMGLGKTLQSIAFIVSELAAIRQKKQPVLIVCPSSLTYNWLQECAKFVPELRVMIVDGTIQKRRQQLQQVDDVDVVITSYPLIRRDSVYYERITFHAIFFDEAQAFKNITTQIARTVKKLNAPTRFALTGTPIENVLEELWAIYYVVFPQLFGSLKQFSELRTEQVVRRVRPFLLRRMKEDVLDALPKKHEQIIYTDLTPTQKKLYAAFLAKLRHTTLKHLDQETFKQNKIRILAGITRLRQICCHPALFIERYEGDSAKFNELLNVIQEAKRAGRRILIFSQFTQMLKLIAQALSEQQLSYFYLDGQTPSEQRVRMCNAFNEHVCDLFLISLKAGGTGLNLTGADTVILYDLWWNPAVEEQAMDRAHRMGQKNEVQVIKLIAKGTIEQKMYELQQRKRHLIDNVLQPNETDTAALTEEDVKEILML